MNVTEHLLSCLGEEGVEVSHICSKANRFGLEDRNVLNPTGPTNVERLVDELNDLMAVVQMLQEHGVLPLSWIQPIKIQKKKRKVKKFILYARKLGTISDE